MNRIGDLIGRIAFCLQRCRERPRTGGDGLLVEDVVEYHHVSRCCEKALAYCSRSSCAFIIARTAHCNRFSAYSTPVSVWSWHWAGLVRLRANPWRVVARQPCKAFSVEVSRRATGTEGAALCLVCPGKPKTKCVEVVQTCQAVGRK